MSGMAARPGMTAERRSKREQNTSPRLARYLERTREPLDLFALCTLWIIAVPIASFGPGSAVTWEGMALRLGISAVFGVDMAVRSWLAPRSFAYLRTHPLGLMAVLVPPVRALFSLRLITSLFRRGHIERFFVAAGLMLLNGVLIVYFYERDAPGANITSVGDSLWWAAATVSTVGYGDMYPVTWAGRAAAVGIMAIGILTLAVVTAQVSASYVEQAARRRAAGADTDSSDLEGHEVDGAEVDPGAVDPRIAASEADLETGLEPDLEAELAELRASLSRIEAIVRQQRT